MSSNWLLIWTVTISCVFGLFSLIRRRVFTPLSYGPFLVVGLVLGIFCWRDVETAGFYSGAVWFVLIFLPGICGVLANQCLGSRKHDTAYIFAKISFLLHPFDGTRDHPVLIKALKRLDSGDDQYAIQELESLQHRSSPSGRAAFAILTRIRGEWQEFIDRIHVSPHSFKLLNDPLISNAYMQALGETGQIDSLLTVFGVQNEGKQVPRSAFAMNIHRLKAAAFCGETELVTLLLDGPLSHLDLLTCKFWLATSIQANGDLEASRELFEEIQRGSDHLLSISAARRIAHPVRVVDDLPAEAKMAFALLNSTIQHEEQFAQVGARPKKFPIATTFLAVTLFCVFGMEMFYGKAGDLVLNSETLTVGEKARLLIHNTTLNPNLVEMGALVLPQGLFPNTWRRIVTSAFLHFGPLHLFMNVIGLLVFGQRVEKTWGPFLTGIAYLFCAIFSIYLLTWLPLQVTEEAPIVLVGASGGVMGLVGCLMGHLAYGQWRMKNSVIRRELNLLTFIVIVQMSFDQMTPNVSSECHLLGLGLGIVTGVIVGHFQTMWLGRKVKRIEK